MDMLPRSGPGSHPAAAGNGRRAHWTAFLVIAFTWSWSCWLWASAIEPQSAQASGVLSALGSFGPGVAALSLIGWTGGRPGLRRWLGRCLQRRIGAGPFAWAFFFPLTVLATAAHRSILGW